jgi:hypothetical protein
MTTSVTPNRQETGSDLLRPDGEEPTPRKASKQILRHESRCLLWATIGNTLGGVVFVAILKYGLARPEAPAVSE